MISKVESADQWSIHFFEKTGEELSSSGSWNSNKFPQLFDISPVTTNYESVTLNFSKIRWFLFNQGFYYDCNNSLNKIKVQVIG